MSDIVLAIDQGTTGTTAAVFDRDCCLRAKVTTEFAQIFPKPGWVEHNLEDIWSSVQESTVKVLQEACVSGKDIQAIGITNQRETTALWDRETGSPLHNAIVWQCRRTTPLCEKLKRQGHELLFRKRTGLVLDPYFSGTKLAWLLEHVKGARGRADRGSVCFGTMDTFLVHRLTGCQKHVTEVSNASRTLLMDIFKLSWDPELLDLLGIPTGVLPEIRSSSENIGFTRGVKGLPDGIPICGMAGDQQAALFGQACFSPGQVKCTYGTGAFVLMNTGTHPVVSRHGLLTTVAWKIDNRVTYALEGSVFIAGALVQWLRDGLRVIQESAQVEALAASVDSSQGVVFVPALTGLGAPNWRPEARGIITGITRGTGAAHLARAALEGIAFSVRDVVECMREDAGVGLDVLRVDGGASANNLMLQFQSDILSIELHRPKILETTAFGAALLAGLCAGLWKGVEDIQHRWEPDRVFVPLAQPEKVATWISQWKSAVEKA